MQVLFAGDITVTRRLNGAVKAGIFDELLPLFKSSDAAYGNLETLLHRFDGFARAESGGTWLNANPHVAHDLCNIGLNLVSRANNHALDYGIESMRRTSLTLDEVGINHAGSGENIEQAREACFYDSPGGRVALVSCSSTFPIGANATTSLQAVSGRPGISPLRFTKEYFVPNEVFKVLQEVAVRCYFDKLLDKESVNIAPHVFKQGVNYMIRSRADTEDLNAIQQVVQDANNFSDLVIVSIHSHEAEGNWEFPAQFLIEATHSIVDAGADIIVCHGPHLLRGIELYKGVPIMYSIGTLIFQNDDISSYPDDARKKLKLPPNSSASVIKAKKFDFSKDERFWQSVIVKGTWNNGGLCELRFYPIKIYQGPTFLEKGLPLLAKGDESDYILNRLISLSNHFGTIIHIDGNEAYIDLNKEE